MGRASLETLASGLGLVGNSGPMFRFVDPPLSVHYADVGDLNAVLPPSAARQRLEPSTLPAGVGVASEPAIARSLALAEALERYCAHAWSVEQFLTAPASALEEEHLDPRRLPRCSEQECDHPLCGWRPADPDLPIRWVKGVSLMTGRTVWLPARAVYLGLEAWPGERFVFANSSGCAAHPSLTRAIVAGLCELVERDAVALTWLQRLAVPRMPVRTRSATWPSAVCGAQVRRLLRAAILRRDDGSRRANGLRCRSRAGSPDGIDTGRMRDPSRSREGCGEGGLRPGIASPRCGAPPPAAWMIPRRLRKRFRAVLSWRARRTRRHSRFCSTPRAPVR